MGTLIGVLVFTAVMVVILIAILAVRSPTRH